MIRVGFRWLERGSCRHPELMTITGGSLCATDFPAMVGVIEHPARGSEVGVNGRRTFRRTGVFRGYG